MKWRSVGMGIFDHWLEDTEDEESQSIFHRDSEDKVAKRRLAEEIANGTVSGLFERDEEVWEMVNKIKENK
jgi:hypothetical protein